MATTRDIPLAIYPTGTRTFVKQTPNGLAGFRIAIARCTSVDTTIWTDPASRLRFTVECSYDGGVTFPINGGNAVFENGGGIVTDRAGSEIPLWNIGCRFSPIQPSAIRITAEVINGPIKTSADVTIN